MQPKTEEALPAGSTVITAIEVKVASVCRRRTKKHLFLMSDRGNVGRSIGVARLTEQGFFWRCF